MANCKKDKNKLYCLCWAGRTADKINKKGAVGRGNPANEKMKFEIKIEKPSCDGNKMADAVLEFLDSVEEFEGNGSGSEAVIYDGDTPFFYSFATLRTDIRHVAEREQKTAAKPLKKIQDALSVLIKKFRDVEGFYLDVAETENYFIVSVEKAGA